MNAEPFTENDRGPVLHVSPVGNRRADRPRHEIALLGYAMLDAGEPGQRQVWLDWGLGDVEYKQRFGTRARREARANLFGRTGRSRWLRGYKGVGDWLGRGVRIAAGRLGILQRIKQTWRRRLAGG